ncbi:unnamed protein product [Cylicostephanus goldi]|uniref:Uncharacterized protein n=1 Tax=Cylicostephanus goldi TaxID=71465 RepID=A0A3P6RL41_CYLGO|nr:unnamed protein product [Cylicostephanus goldi]
MALKKQAALVKELQRALREEKKRAESMEKHGMSSPEERGWHLVSDPDSRSGQVCSWVYASELPCTLLLVVGDVT